MEAPLPNGVNGRDPQGRFLPGNTASDGRAHAFAKQAAALCRAFYDEVTPADMRCVVRKLITEATGGNLQAARLLLLWVIGKLDDAVHPDGSARLIAAEAQAATPSQPMPDDREACMDLAAMELGREIRARPGGRRHTLLDPDAAASGQVLSLSLEELASATTSGVGPLMSVVSWIGW